MDITILTSIALLLIGAKLLGELTEKLKLTAIVGEILAGVLLGSVLGLVTVNPVLNELSFFGIVLLVFLLGLSTKFDDVKKEVYAASILAAGGCLLSFFLGLAAGIILFNNLIIGVFVGVAIMSTSISTTCRALVEMGKFNTRYAKTLLSIDMADTIIAVLALSSFMAYITFKSIAIGEIAKLFLLILGFMLVLLTAASKVLTKMLSAVQRLKDEEILFTIPLALVLLISAISDQLGVTAVAGAFLAGMAMNKSPLAEPIILPKVKSIGYGFFIPLFFAYSAVQMDINALFSSFWLISLLVIIGIVGKYIGTGLLSGYFGFRDYERNIIGIGMVPRGSHVVIVSQIALAAGIITAPLYTAMIVFMIMTLLLTPVLLRIVA